jgi:antitoxin MazE
MPRLQKWGNSQGLKFPKHVLKQACIEVGDEVKISVENGAIVIGARGRARRTHTLEKLVAKMTRQYKPVAEDWGAVVGKET